MKKIWKIGLSLGIVTIGITAIVPPVVICETSTTNKINSNQTVSLVDGENSQSEVINSLSNKWVNDNENTQFVDNLFSQITNSNLAANANATLLDLPNSKDSIKSINYKNLNLIKSLPLASQNKIKNGMLASYIKIKSYINSTKGNINIKNYLAILSPYVSKRVVQKIQERIVENKNNSNLKNKTSSYQNKADLFSLPTISFAYNSMTVGQYIDKLSQIRNDSNYVAIAASIIAVAAGIAGFFIPPLETVATIAGLAAFACSTISFATGSAVDSLEEDIGENPNWTTAVVSSCSATTKIGLKIIATTNELNQNLDDFDEWVEYIPLLGNIISLICEIFNAVEER